MIKKDPMRLSGKTQPAGAKAGGEVGGSGGDHRDRDDLLGGKGKKMEDGDYPPFSFP
jgi:hypothetical protein